MFASCKKKTKLNIQYSFFMQKKEKKKKSLNLSVLTKDMENFMNSAVINPSASVPTLANLQCREVEALLQGTTRNSHLSAI